MTTSNQIPFYIKENSSSSFNHLIEINLMNILDLIYRYDQWGMRQNHAGYRNNNRLDDPNLLLILAGHEAESCRSQYNNKIMGLTHLSTYRYFNDLVT